MRPRPARPNPPARPVLGSWTVGLAALVAYLGLTPTVPGGKDGAEFVLVLATNGLASDRPVFLFLPEVPLVRMLHPTPDSSSTP